MRRHRGACAQKGAAHQGPDGPRRERPGCLRRLSIPGAAASGAEASKKTVARRCGDEGSVVDPGAPPFGHPAYATAAGGGAEVLHQAALELAATNAADRA